MQHKNSKHSCEETDDKWHLLDTAYNSPFGKLDGNRSLNKLTLLMATIFDRNFSVFDFMLQRVKSECQIVVVKFRRYIIRSAVDLSRPRVRNFAVKLERVLFRFSLLEAIFPLSLSLLSQ